MTAVLSPDQRRTAIIRLNTDIARETERTICVLAARNDITQVEAALAMVRAIVFDLEHYNPHAITNYLMALVKSTEAGRMTDAIAERLNAAARTLINHTPANGHNMATEVPTC
jgi:hypothetical protein